MDNKPKGPTVTLPCNLGDRLWAVSFNDDTGQWEVSEMPPVMAIAVRACGRFFAECYGDGFFDSLGGPVLYLTEAEARDQLAQRAGFASMQSYLNAVQAEHGPSP